MPADLKTALIDFLQELTAVAKDVRRAIAEERAKAKKNAKR